MRVVLYFLVLSVAGKVHFVNRANGCFTSYPLPTISEQIASADVVILGEWVSAQKLPGNAGPTTFHITEVIKDSTNKFTKTGRFDFAGNEAGKPGDLAMFLGYSQDRQLEWGDTVPITETSLKYIKALPKSDESWESRLGYFVQNLESPDERVAEDAYDGVVIAPFAEMKKVSAKLPREKLRQWIANKKTSEGRISQYGLMLGICGTEDDATFLRDFIKNPVEKEGLRLGIAGVMSGYLLLKGDEGLKLLEDTKLKPGKTTDFHESYSALQAVRFAWDNVGTIKKDRLIQAMTLLLDDPIFADLVVNDFVRWKYWAVQDKLMAFYDKKEFDSPVFKRAVARYMIGCSKDTKENSDQNPIEEYAITAKNHLLVLRQKDPKIVEQAERFYHLLD